MGSGPSGRDPPLETAVASSMPPCSATLSTGMTSPDVIVIGGRIAGVAAGYYLTPHGHRVTLVERGELAGEASGLNAGSIDAIGWGRVPDLQVHLTTGSLELFAALARGAGRYIGSRRC